MYTYPKAQFYFTDVSARADSTPSSQQKKEFSDPNQLKENIRMKPYGTMELNQFILDGNMAVFTQPPTDIPFWNSEISGEDGSFAVNPVIEIMFQKPHSSVGLTLFLAGDLPEKVKVVWYTAYGTELDRGLFIPDGSEFFCENAVSNYSRVSIEFLSTSWPFRFIKVNSVEYGKICKISRENIREASICEETDLTGATLAVNTAKVVIVDENNSFDLTRQDGLWKYLQRDQSIWMTEMVNGNVVDCGIFYLESWEVQQNLVTFSLTDIIGKMDKTIYYEGQVYNQVPAGQIIGAIMESCGVEDYFVDNEVSQRLLSGWLGIQTHREALQQAAFACSAMVERSRSGVIRVCFPESHVSHSIGLERKFIGTKAVLDEYVSGVSVGYLQYNPENEYAELSKGLLPAGVTRIEFSEPCQPDDFTVNTGTVVRAGTNYVDISMPVESECVVTGRKYKSNGNSYTVRLPVMEPGEVENIKSYDGCTLMNVWQARNTAERILQFYQRRQIVEINYLNGGEAAGDWCSIAQQGGRYCVTCITGQTVDLAGGNLASAKCRGYSREITDFCFAGEGLFAGNTCEL